VAAVPPAPLFPPLPKMPPVEEIPPIPLPAPPLPVDEALLPPQDWRPAARPDTKIPSSIFFIREPPCSNRRDQGPRNGQCEPPLRSSSCWALLRFTQIHRHRVRPPFKGRSREDCRGVSLDFLRQTHTAPNGAAGRTSVPSPDRPLRRPRAYPPRVPLFLAPACTINSASTRAPAPSDPQGPCYAKSSARELAKVVDETVRSKARRECLPPDADVMAAMFCAYRTDLAQSRRWCSLFGRRMNEGQLAATVPSPTSGVQCSPTGLLIGARDDLTRPTRPLGGWC